MNLRKTLLSIAIIIAFGILGLSGCKKEEPPTKTSMEGTWTVTEAYDGSGNVLAHNINFPITAFHLSSDNGVVSTAGPMIMYIVYGDNQYTNIASKVDQVFNYVSLDFNNGEFFVGGGVQERFTLEMKLEGLPGQKALTDLLGYLGIGNDYLDVVIYHKFMDVLVSFEDDYNTMIWEFDATTSAVYNKKDNYGNYVLWGGWPVENFSHSRFVLTKQVKDLADVVKDAS